MIVCRAMTTCRAPRVFPVCSIPVEHSCSLRVNRCEFQSLFHSVNVHIGCLMCGFYTDTPYTHLSKKRFDLYTIYVYLYS